MSKLFIISILLSLSTLCQNKEISEFFNRPFAKTESESDCLCDIDNEHCNYLCCCDTKCGENVKKYWDDRSKCIDEKDSVGIFADRCIDHTLVIDFKGHKDKNYRRRGLERIKATEDISNSNETIDNYCYSIDNSNKMKKEITNMKIDTSKITDESSSQNGNSARRLEKVNNNKNNNNKKYISINENHSFSNTNNQLRAIEEKNINITYGNDIKVFGKNNKFSLYSGSICINNIYVERMVNANYSCSMDRNTNKDIINALNEKYINLSDTQCKLDKIYKIDSGILNTINSNTPINVNNDILVEVEFIMEMVNYDSISGCYINVVTMTASDEKFNFKNTVIFSNKNSIPYRYSGTNGYLNGLPLKVAVGSNVYNEFYIVGRDKDGNCRVDEDINNYLYFYDKPILFNQNYSYSCSLNGKNIGQTTLFQRLKKIKKIAKYGNSHYSKLDDQSLWINVNKDKLSEDNALIKMNIYLGTRKIGVHSYKYIYKVILKSIKKNTKEDTLSLDINYYDLDKKQDFEEKPRIPEFIPSMPADLLDPLIYSKVDK